MIAGDAFQKAKLRLREDTADSQWQVWELKTLNLHRGVLHWRLGASPGSYAELAAEIRRAVRRYFRVSWWRGFGFGVLIESPAIPADISAIEEAIDTRASGLGTWQWTVFACEPQQFAVGVHTWTAGYLSPVYRDVISSFESRGWTVGSFKKEKDRLMQFLLTVASIKGYRVQEFEP
jgi:hypothetical protein